MIHTACLTVWLSCVSSRAGYIKKHRNTAARLVTLPQLDSNAVLHALQTKEETLYWYVLIHDAIFYCDSGDTPCEATQSHVCGFTDVLHLTKTFVTQCWTSQNCFRDMCGAHLPCECWSRGLGGGAIPLCPPCLKDSPFTWLKRLSSLMLFSCMVSMGCGRNSTAWKLKPFPLRTY